MNRFRRRHGMVGISPHGVWRNTHYPPVWCRWVGAAHVACRIYRPPGDMRLPPWLRTGNVSCGNRTSRLGSVSRFRRLCGMVGISSHGGVEKYPPSSGLVSVGRRNGCRLPDLSPVRRHARSAMITDWKRVLWKLGQSIERVRADFGDGAGWRVFLHIGVWRNMHYLLVWCRWVGAAVVVCRIYRPSGDMRVPP